MKRNIYKMIIVLTAVLLSACNLNVTDETAITSDIALTNVSAFNNVLATAYSTAHSFNFYGRDTYLQGDVLADNLYISVNSGRYVGEQTNAEGSHFSRWYLYEMINDCNIVINRIDDSSVEGEQADKDPVKGQAYFLRALAYHEMLRSYAYEPGQYVNDFELGVVPRITAIMGYADVTDLPRVTVAEGYAQLESDLNNAIALLPAQSASDVYHATKAGAQALLARVLLYEGKWSDAATAADAALAGTTAELVDSAGYVASFGATPHPESIFELKISAVDWNTVDGANNSLCSYTNDLTTGSFFCLSPSTEFLNLLAEEPADVRNNLIITSTNSVTLGLKEIYKWQGEQGTFLENIPVIRYSEMLLTVAEAKARAGDAAGATTAITTFRANRVPSASPVTATGQALIDLILRERRLEFVEEGHRYYDLKRLGQSITKSTEAKLLGAQDLPYNNYKVLSRIPVSEVKISTQLKQNPGY